MELPKPKIKRPARYVCQFWQTAETIPPMTMMTHLMAMGSLRPYLSAIGGTMKKLAIEPRL